LKTRNNIETTIFRNDSRRLLVSRIRVDSITQWSTLIFGDVSLISCFFPHSVFLPSPSVDSLTPWASLTPCACPNPHS